MKRAMLTLLALLAPLAAHAGVFERVTNRLDVETVLEAQGVADTEAGVVFSYTDPGLSMKYDRIDGVNRIVSSDSTTVGFLHIAPGFQAKTAIYRQGDGGQRVCVLLDGPGAPEGEEKVKVYQARHEEGVSEQAQMLVGKTGEGDDLLVVWMEPGQQLTTVTAVDQRSHRKLRRTEFHQDGRQLVFLQTPEGSLACASLEESDD